MSAHTEQLPEAGVVGRRKGAFDVADSQSSAWVVTPGNGLQT